MFQKLFNFISVLNRNSEVLQAGTKIIFHPDFCSLNCQGYLAVTLSSSCWPFQTFHIALVPAKFPSREYELILFSKQVTTENATASPAKQRLTYTESCCDSQLFALGLARKPRIWTDVKQLWYWINAHGGYHTLINLYMMTMLMCNTLPIHFISTISRKKLIKH